MKLLRTEKAMLGLIVLVTLFGGCKAADTGEANRNAGPDPTTGGDDDGQGGDDTIVVAEIDRFLGQWKYRPIYNGGTSCQDTVIEITHEGSAYAVSEHTNACGGASQTFNGFLFEIDGEKVFVAGSTREIGTLKDHKLVVSNPNAIEALEFEVSDAGGMHVIDRQSISEWWGDLALVDSPFEDYDQDTIPDLSDNCRFDQNSNQADLDNDGTGDACDIFFVFQTQPSLAAQDEQVLAQQPVIKVVDFKGRTLTNFNGGVFLQVRQSDLTSEGGSFWDLSSQQSASTSYLDVTAGVAEFTDIALKKSATYSGPVVLCVEGQPVSKSCSTTIQLQ